MKYIHSPDYHYIMNKYHDSSKPFDAYSRFIRRDEIFSDETGMDGQKIKEEVLRRDEEMCDLPHVVRKARAFAFVLENTKISCDNGKQSKRSSKTTEALKMLKCIHLSSFAPRLYRILVCNTVIPVDVFCFVNNKC